MAFLLPAVALAGCFGVEEDAPGGGFDEPAPSALWTPNVVIAHVDTGINPYHANFRWNDTRAWVHPSKWLVGYPPEAQPLNLTLDAPTYADALRADAAVWEGVQEGSLYWIPGTKIVGAITFGPGGKYCPPTDVPPANQVLTGPCIDHPIVDDFGHGTMTASRMGGNEHSLNPDGLIVSIEAGDIPRALNFIKAAGWIDVVSNSWGFIEPSPLVHDAAVLVKETADHALFLFASGNGLGFINGVVGQPTYLQSTAPRNVILVGAHDNGYATLWHEAPVHIVADAYGGWRASPWSLDEMQADPDACCTSAAAPYASGGAASILLEARRILNDTRTGLRGEGDEGIIAEGASGLVPAGPLADGKFTLGELKEVYKKTAEARPVVTSTTADDGLIHWTAKPGTVPRDPWLGDNPYCVGCWTSPVPLSSIPTTVNLAYLIGYGAVTSSGQQSAFHVLWGDSALPNRSAEDGFFAAEGILRGALNPGPPLVPG